MAPASPITLGGNVAGLHRNSIQYLCHSIERAKNLAGVMARDRGMELIDEATTA